MKIVEPSYVVEDCPDGEKVLAKLERAARTCYKSEGGIIFGGLCLDCAGSGEGPPRLAGDRESCSRCRGTGKEEPSSHKLVRRILDSGHLSVIEHASITVRFICDRGVTHELVRHRLAAYSQESTRYCNYSKGKFGGEVTFVKPCFWRTATHTELERYHMWCNAMQAAEGAYLDLLVKGASPQEARSVLPNSLKTEIVMTANLREWRHVFKLRCSEKAHPQMRQLMVPLRDELRGKIPLVFDEPEPHKYDVDLLGCSREALRVRAALEEA
jgi:thymidylate synthase (FAD)